MQVGEEPKNFSSFTQFKCVVFIHEAVSESWRHKIANWLVQSGSLYVMTWGVDCSIWHDSVDIAVLEIFDYGDIPDDRFIFTTWHTDEDISEVMFYAKTCAFHDTVELNSLLFLDIGKSGRKEELLELFDKS